MRRIATPLKRFVIEIAKHVKGFSSSQDDELALFYDDVIDHIDKVIETLEESRETMEIYKDTDFVLSTEKTKQSSCSTNNNFHTGNSINCNWHILWNER